VTKRRVKADQAKDAPIRLDLFYQLLLVVIAATITTFPFIFDSFTVSKLLILAIGLTYISIKLFQNKDANAIRPLPKSLWVLISFFALSMVVSWYHSDVPLLRALFGQFGRGNGLFYYFFAILIFVYAIKTFKSTSASRIHHLITILSWFMAFYAALQRVGIDIAKLDTKGISPVVLTFGNSNFAGGMLSVLFAYHFTYSVLLRDFHIKRLTLLFSLILSTTFSAAVQGYLIILFSIALTLSILIIQKVRSPWMMNALISAWTLGFISVVLGVFGKFIFAGVFARTSFQIRIEYWRISLSVIRDFPIFGVGPDKLYDVTPNYMSPGSLQLITTTRMDNAHNWFLNLGANYGLISMFLLLSILGVVLFYSRSLLRNLSKVNCVAVPSVIAFICMLVDALVSIEQPGIGIWLYMFAGVVVASALERLGNSGVRSSTKGPQFISQLTASRFAITLISSLLLISCVTISQRIYLDGILRSNIQTLLLGKGTTQTLSNVESATIGLRSEPEYTTQALRPLAELGDAIRLNVISKSVYEYYPNSIQANIIRAEVLKALNLADESCVIRKRLIQNTPWDFGHLDHFISCLLDGYSGANDIAILQNVSRFPYNVDRSAIPADSNELIATNARLSFVAVRARLYFLIGQMQPAKDLQMYGNNLLTRLMELQASNPTSVMESQINKFKKLLDF
jgi:O-antigen ligase